MSVREPWSQASQRLFAVLENCEGKQLTGCLHARVADSQSWYCHFFLGRLAWIEGGTHPWRSWNRQLAAHGDAALRTRADRLRNRLESAASAADSLQALAAQLLSTRALTPELFVRLFEGLCRDSLFDLVWELERGARAGDPRGGLVLAADKSDRRGTGNVLPHNWLLSPGQLRGAVRQDWGTWQTKIPPDLVDCHPDWAPRILEPALLSSQLEPTTFERMSILLDGTHTFRDIAQALQHDAAALVRMLYPYWQQQWLCFQDVADRPPTSKAIPEGSDARRVIACVDDSSQMLTIIEAIVSQEGHKFVGIEESLQAIPRLVAEKPDLIFLDVVMPVLNGYEVCQRLKQIGALKETPVIMLSSRLIDKVRAKLAGACDCLEKPVSPQQLVEAIARYARQGAEPEGAASVRAASPGRDNSAAGAQRPKLVACIDDCTLTRKAFKQVVAAEGHDFVGIGNSVDGLLQLSASEPDLILLDLVLPLIGGYELCRRLRQIQSLANVPIVLFSGSTIDRDLAHAAGATAGVAKPEKPETLLQLLREHLGVARIATGARQ